MKRLGCLGNIVFLLNIIAVVLLAVSFFTPYIPPQKFPTLSMLSLLVSPLLLINLLFAVYWLIRLRKQMLWSVLVLIIAYFHFNSTFEFASEGDAEAYENTLKVLSHNVRLFNAYEENPKEDAKEVLDRLIEEQDPDLVFIQEYYRDTVISFPDYPYRLIHFKHEKANLGHAIFSKYPLINRGGFNFQKTGNNSLYADMVKGNDTIRLYNVHLQSLGIEPSVDYIQEGDKEKLRQRMGLAFMLQQTQTEAIVRHKNESPYPVILCGDFNNTSFSYVYRQLQEGMTDAFEARGGGLGTTFSFDFYPMRIDYIFSSTKMEVISFETLDTTFSDHYPITATLGWN